MFILTFQSYSNIPEKRNEFYSQVFDALFSVHDSMSKLAFVREKQSGLSKEQFIDVLKLFSFISYFDEKFIFSATYLTQKLVTIKEKKKSIQFDNEKLINDLQVAIGILNKEGTDFTFPHRSLQEYFAALYISTLNEENKKIVYSKILKGLINNRKFSASARDNFYLLLSEIDEKSIIKIAIIPFLEAFVRDYNKTETDSKKIIEAFLNIHSTYAAFHYVFKNNDLSIFYESLNGKFSKYLREFEAKNLVLGVKSTVDNRISYHEPANEKLALMDIKPFMDMYINAISLKKTELTDYLLNENISDAEIISLV